MRRIFGMGEIVLDVIFKDNQPVAAKVGGSVLNAMVSLVRVGLDGYFISELGSDRVGDLILDFLTVNNISIHHIRRYAEGQSSLALAFLDHRNDASYEFYKPYPAERSLIVPDDFCADDILLFGSFYAIDDKVRHDVLKVVNKARDAGALIVYDPNFRSSHAGNPNCVDAIIENMKLADIVRGSDEDFKNIFGLSDPAEVYNRIEFWCPNVVITANANGGEVLTPRVKFHFDVPPIQPVSTIGAGDNFNAGMISALVSGGVDRKLLPVMDQQAWTQIINRGIDFSSAVCMSLDNYVPVGFE